MLFPSQYPTGMTPDISLPPEKVSLTVVGNKVQLIDIICQHLKERKDNLNEYDHKLVVAGKDPTPVQVSNGTITMHDDLRTTYEEADVHFVQQMVKLTQTAGITSIKVICDDTDIFILLVHFYSLKKLTGTLVMTLTSAGKTVIDIRATVKKHAILAQQRYMPFLGVIQYHTCGVLGREKH